MPSLYKLKVIAVGNSRRGKDFFFKNCDQISNFFSESSLVTVGVSIKMADYTNENGDILKMAIWDINANERFHFLYSSFFRGAAGCILFFDFLDNDLFNNLLKWINLVRANIDHIPLLLVGFNSDFEYKFIYEKMSNFVENNHLNGFYCIPTQIKFIINRLATDILENIRSKASVVKVKKGTNIKDMKRYQKFLHSFLICPICKSKNHITNINKFYFSKDPELRKLKEILLRLMKKSKRFDKMYLNEIKLGIPCCSCYNKIFSERE